MRESNTVAKTVAIIMIKLTADRKGLVIIDTELDINWTKELELKGKIIKPPFQTRILNYQLGIIMA